MTDHTARLDPATLTWRKSSRSDGAGECVETAAIPGHGVAVRDSKTPDGPILSFAGAEWDRFVRMVADGDARA